MDKSDFHCDHIGILTKNADRLINFYVEELGFHKEKEDILSMSISKKLFGVNIECRFCRLYLGDIKVEIFEPLIVAEEGPGFPFGYHHWGFWVDDKEGYLAKLSRDQVPIIEIKKNGHSVHFIKDPDGNLIEVRSS